MPNSPAANPADPPRALTGCVVVAAGSGSRMGAARNKVLLDLEGEPIITHTLRHLAATDCIDEFVLVVRAEERADFEHALAPLGLGTRLRFAHGGAERADSVANGIAALEEATALVLIHDGARPFVSTAIVRALCAAATTHGAAIPALPLTDTVKRVRAGRIESTLDRSELAGAQTPQAFAAHSLREARAACDPEFRPTDDAALFERLGRAVIAIPGDPLNVKLTTPHDLSLAPSLLALFRERERRGSR